MKTLVLTEVFPPKTGGSGRWLWELYSRWPREDVVVLAGEHPQAAEFDKTHDLNIQRLPLTFPSWGVVGFANVRDYTAAYRTVAAAVKQHSARAVHCGRMLPEGLIAWMLSVRHRVPYAVYVHGEELNTFATSRELSFLARRVMKGATVLIANSRNTAAVLTRTWNVPATKIDVQNPGVDTARFTPVPRDAAMRERLGWGEHRVILTVGRLQKRKGHARLIAALPGIIERVPEAIYAIVGAGEELAALERRADELNVMEHVQFLGEQREEMLVACVRQCDLLALPNVEIAGDFEGFGMVLVEAQACGKPVIAGRSGGTAETMIEGETGLLVSCEDTAALAAAVVDLLSDDAKRERMGAAGRRWVEERFDWKGLTERARRMFALRFGGVEARSRIAA